MPHKFKKRVYDFHLHVNYYIYIYIMSSNQTYALKCIQLNYKQYSGYTN